MALGQSPFTPTFGRVADIKARMGKKSNCVSQYKRRLVAQGVIEDRGHGMLAIEIPFFKEHLRKRLA